jgi:PAS domain S-box-containing protein
MTKAGNQAWGALIADEQVRRLREMFAQSPSFSALLQGPGHRFVLTNPAYQQLIGHRDVIGLTVREAIPEAERQGFIDLLDRVFATGEPFVGKDAKIVFSGVVWRPRGNALSGFRLPADQERAWRRYLDIFVEGVDITARHNSEEALRVSEARLRQQNADLERQVIERAQARGLTWKLSPDLLGALNSKGYFETANPAWESVLGWTEPEVLSMSIFELLHPDDLEHTRAGFELTQVGQPALRFVNRYRCKDGSYRWISWIGIPEEGYVYCTGRDVTTEREAEIELAAAQEALRHSQRNGRDRSAYRRRGSRLQQPFDRHHRLPRHRSQADHRRPAPRDPTLHRRSLDRSAAGWDADASPAGLCAASAARHTAKRCQPHYREYGRPSEPDVGRAR